MGWINLVAEGPRLKVLAAKYLDHMRQNPGELELGRMPALTSLMIGDVERYREAFAFAADEFDSMKSRPERVWGSIEVLPDLIGFSILFYEAGEDQTELWNRIVAIKHTEDRHMQALQHVVSWLVDPDSRPKRAYVPGPGPIHGLPGLLRVLDKAPLSYLFDSVISPDNQDWAFDLDSFVLPLGLLLFEKLRSTGVSVDLFDLFRLGAHPEWHRDVVYLRRWPRPVWNAQPVAGRPETWLGFDAVEFVGDELRVYHYLTLKWQAPLIFEAGANAFAFLDQLSANWEFVSETVTAVQWKRISDARNRAGVRHVVVHDASMSPVLPGHLAKAAEYYHVELITKDVTEV